MKKAQLELALRHAAEIAKERDWIVFGSQAVLGLVGRPPKECLVSMEVDVYPRRNFRAAHLVTLELGRRSPFAREHGFFVDCVDPGLATFPDGWQKRLVPFRPRKTKKFTGWCVEIHDLAVSKLAAGREKDFDFVAVLIRRKLVKVATIQARLKQTPMADEQRESLLAELQSMVSTVAE